MTDVWISARELLTALAGLLFDLVALAFRHALLIAWLAWWLWGVNWSRVWPVLARGGWVVVVLLMLTGALVWSRLAPSDCECLGFVAVHNFWWQLGAVGLLVAVTLFCGWLQQVFHWQPADIDLEPPEPAADHGHGHAAH